MRTVYFDSLSPPCGHAGFLHEEREADGPEGGGGAGWGSLPHRGDAERRREGEGGPAPPQRINRTAGPENGPSMVLELETE